MTETLQYNFIFRNNEEDNMDKAIKMLELYKRYMEEKPEISFRVKVYKVEKK